MPGELVIRCSGQRINRYAFRAVGPICGELFVSAAPYRTVVDWIERARVAGWRVSPLQPDHTVNAYCPSCR